MARSIENRLRNLATRRKGGDRLDRVSPDQAIILATDGFRQETWERRAGAQPFTRYALGAMEAVDRRYTEISIETATRVGRQLKDNLPMQVDFRLQGSVPLDVHIRGVSDVDLLTLDADFFVYDRNGPRGSGWYSPSTQTSLGVLTRLRLECEKVLRNAYPAAKVDTTGAKAINLRGGSLARPIDVVPSHW